MSNIHNDVPKAALPISEKTADMTDVNIIT